MTKPKLIGIDVGGTNLRLGVFEDMVLLEEARHQADFSRLCKTLAPDVAWQNILDVIAKAVNAALEKHHAVDAIGIGFPGFIDPITRLIAQSPNLSGLQNVNLAADLAKLINKKVIVENDALAAAYGEFCLAGRPSAGLLYFGLGTGVGGGMVYAGRPFAGYHGVAMEVGHIIIEVNGRLCGCGNQGCMEQYASASGVSISYSELTGRQLASHQIADIARDGDKSARAAYVRAGEAMAITLAHVMKVVDVPNVVIGGGMCQGWDLMQDAFNARLQADLIPVLRGKLDIHISTCGDRAGMLGAALLAMD